MHITIYPGDKFNKLTAVRRIPRKGKWLWKCDCGNTKEIQTSNVPNGHVRSCGCLKRFSHLTHGMSHTRFYRVWKHILERCTNPNDKRYHVYGGRGIKCRWRSFGAFHKDMYPSYVAHCEELGVRNTTIERVNVNKGYSKENCRWATWKEQANNKQFHSR